MINFSKVYLIPCSDYEKAQSNTRSEVADVIFNKVRRSGHLLDKTFYYSLDGKCYRVEDWSYKFDPSKVDYSA